MKPFEFVVSHHLGDTGRGRDLAEDQRKYEQDEELPPWPRHWRNWQTVTDEHGLLAVVRPEQLELPTDQESSEEEASFEEITEYSETGAVLFVCFHCMHVICASFRAVAGILLLERLIFVGYISWA